MRTPSPTDRPTLEGSRRTNWRTFFLREWSLLLLAAALALIIWDITSRRVVSTRFLRGVEIRLEVDESIRDRVGAVLTGNRTTQDFELYCSEREQNEALEALNVGGRSVVVMRITRLDQDQRALNARIDRYDWPFANHDRILVQDSVIAPEGDVFALEGAHPRVDWIEEDRATVPGRSVLEERGIEVQIKVSLDKVDLMAPLGRVEDPAWETLQPDPINLASVAGEMVAYGDIPFDSPLRYDLTFERWRAGGTTTDSAWRRKLDLPEISAVVTLVETGTADPKNRVIFQLPQEYQARVDRQATPGVGVAGKLLFTGKLTGPKAVLEALQADLGGWAWGIELQDPSQLPDGTMNEGASPWKKVRARFVWYPTKSDYRDRGVVFVPEPGQDDFDIEVRWNPRDP